MQVDQQSAELVAVGAITAPYRQVEVLTTREFIKWLNRRDISLQWETLHHLWCVGVLHPVAILEPALGLALDTEQRFLPIELGYEVPSFIDLGRELTGKESFAPPLFELDPKLADAVLWHPFQLWMIDLFYRLLQVHVARDSMLDGPESYWRSARRDLEELPRRLVEFANSEKQHSFLRILALLLHAEPLIHLSLDSNVRSYPHLGQSLDDYLAWQASAGGRELLTLVGLSIAEAESWHHDLAVAAQLEDPLAHFRILVRHASRAKRARLKGRALHADMLYETAEVVRRYLEQYHGRELLEEDDARYGPQSPAVKRRLYGSHRTADFQRAILRRVVREFGLDPQARTTWLLEGSTEFAFIERLASYLSVSLTDAGVELLDLGGVDTLDDKRLRQFLERLQREEVFVFASVDHERGGEHLRVLRNCARQGLLSAGFNVWEPDFESANFTLVELAQVASRLASDGGTVVDLTADNIQLEMEMRDTPAGKAIENILHRARSPAAKGANWGRYLADHAVAHDCPPEVADAEGNRPIITTFSRMLRGQQSHYPATVKRFRVSDEGQLVPKSK